MLNPDYVTVVKWWEYPEFVERHVLEAPEIVAFDLLDPALRSRGSISEKAKQLYSEASFQKQMRTLFNGEPSGQLVSRPFKMR